ncbi:class I SAM-dependent methyltransferase [Bradyrhizobium diazoefficiens]|uniref:SAM-dependent methyltransferase n=1 Tax=Bradyrhizobium diazoefficiens TaxID=1355477 RepID=UPI00190BA6D9|nr:class I SAM-dependent methyltransferase [Bradyrhizobium diazoefficiens]
MLHPGQRVLDIGCGWGGLGLEAVSNLRQRCGIAPATSSTEAVAASGLLWR